MIEKKMKKMKKKQKLMCKIIACKLKNEFIQTLHSKQLHEAGDWQSEIVEKPTRTKRICSIFSLSGKLVNIY